MELKKRLLQILAAAAIFTGLYFTCLRATQGFRPYLILSNLPNDPRWEAPPISLEEQKEVQILLDQPFTFLGSGGWCFAFLGQDQKTVLKFYRHDHLRPSFILKNFSLGNLLLKSPPWPQNTPYFQEFIFNSCMLTYSQAKERTGLLHVHLNKTEGLYPTVTLIDAIGVRHTIDLDKTEFVLQKKADLLYPHIDHLVHAQKTEDAKRCIDDLFACLLTFYKSGAKDHDRSLQHNFGFVDGRAIALDLSSFGSDEAIAQPENYKKEIALKTWRFRRWLKKRHHDLYLYYEDQLSELMKKD
jgi:hypothetical protein